MIIYCPDNFELLNKLRYDLIKVGYVDFCENDDNAIDGIYPRILRIYPEENHEMLFLRFLHLHYFNDLVRYDLTPSNYAEILKILTDKINNK